jgi:hypothetical protein
LRARRAAFCCPVIPAHIPSCFSVLIWQQNAANPWVIKNL